MIGMIIDTVTVLIEKPVAPKIKEANIPYHCHVDAASRIIFFIKLLFGLDDCKERLEHNLTACYSMVISTILQQVCKIYQL